MGCELIQSWEQLRFCLNPLTMGCWVLNFPPKPLDLCAVLENSISNSLFSIDSRQILNCSHVWINPQHAVPIQNELLSQNKHFNQYFLHYRYIHLSRHLFSENETNAKIHDPFTNHWFLSKNENHALWINPNLGEVEILPPIHWG